MWHRNRKARRSAPEPVGCDIVHECELYLAGRYAHHLQSAGRPVPSWAWLNPLAHGTREEVASWAGGARHRDAPPEWSQAITFLAGTVLEVAGDDPAELSCLQQQILVPLELQLAAKWFEPMTPSRLVKLVAADLRGSERNRPAGE